MKMAMVLFLFALAALSGCGSSSPVPADVFVVFHDRIDPKYEWVIIVGPTETFLQKAEFPGYANAQWYALPKNDRADASFTIRGNLQKPFVPDGPNLMRSVLSDTGETRDEAFFSDDTADLCRFLTAMESVAAKSPRQKELPEWVKSHAFLLRPLGIEN